MSEDELLLEEGPRDAPWTLLLAHGAGAPMDSPFLLEISGRIAAGGVRVVRFEFPYMRRRRADGGRRPPDRMPALERAYREAVDAARGPGRLAVGGKSMGGRVATRVADGCAADAAVALGYPFHPPRRPETLRTAHLVDLRTPTLVVQGTRDPFGGPHEVGGWSLSGAITCHWIEDGDHSLKPRKRSGRTPGEALDEAAEAVLDFLREVGARDPGPDPTPLVGW